MDSILVRGGAELRGEIPISGAKNACLTLMPAALLTRRAADADQRAAALRHPHDDARFSRASAARSRASRRAACCVIGAEAIANHRADYDIVRKMRASILVLGPMLARDGQAVVSLPGGCAIGARPVDLHLRGARGARRRRSTCARAMSTPRRRTAGSRARSSSSPSSRSAPPRTLLMAATLAHGTTVLRNAAREPEIVDLAHCLRAMGAQIAGEGTDTIELEGVDRPPRRDAPGRRRPHRARHLHARPRDHRRRGRTASAAAATSSRPSPTSSRRPGHRRRPNTNARPQGRARERPHPRGRRGDRPLPRLPDRPAGADDGASLPSPTASATSRSASSRTASCTPPNSCAWARGSTSTAAPPP